MQRVLWIDATGLPDRSAQESFCGVFGAVRGYRKPRGNLYARLRAAYRKQIASYRL